MWQRRRRDSPTLFDLDGSSMGLGETQPGALPERNSFYGTRPRQWGHLPRPGRCRRTGAGPSRRRGGGIRWSLYSTVIREAGFGEFAGGGVGSRGCGERGSR